MNRTGLLIALTVAVAIGLLFGLYPSLDLAISAPFNDGFDKWVGSYVAIAEGARIASEVTIALIAAPAVLALGRKLVRPQRPIWPVSARAAVFMVVTLALAPGIVANVVLKDNWGRPRPLFVSDFGGPNTFVPWWDPRGDCVANCSFIAGEPSGAFWTLAPAVLAPPQWRAVAVGAALTFGIAVGALRLVAGGHFFSDIAFAGVLTFLVIWIVHGLIFRWPRTRVTDAAVESSIERFALALHGRLFARPRRATPPGGSP